MSRDEIFNNLRQKLDVLGYHQPLPLTAVSLVGALFEDLLKTTESLRDSKLKISNLLEEKCCWELGVEPYKCDNSRLLTECNSLHLQLIKQREEFEEQMCDYAKKIRNLESDKLCLEDHCIELESQVRELTLKYSDANTIKSKKDGVNMSKRPFVSTVRTGALLRNPSLDHHSSKCTKCNSIIWAKQAGCSFNIEMEKLKNDVKEKSDQSAIYKKKVEERDREIRRLNELLTGGRPHAALAKDCCYKNVGSLSEDVERLQSQKIDNLKVIQDIQESMHEAKERALCLAERNNKLEKELKELKATALSVEQQANEEITKRECKITKLNDEIKKMKKQISEDNENRSYDRPQRCADEKLRLNERLNELILREKELEAEIDRITKKNIKLKNKLAVLQKESEENIKREDKTELDEERIRLKSERDLFQKEYLRLVEKSGPSTEICYLKSQLKDKEDELHNLRAEISQLRLQTGRTSCNKSSLSTSVSVQAAILRAERERDIAGAELDRVKLERNALREKLQYSTEAQISETDRFCKEIEQLNMKISNLEKANRELLSAQIPGQTHLALMKEEIEALKKRTSELQAENCKLSSSHNQLKILHEQTERALVEYQNKLAIAETNLRNAESRLGALSTNRESTRTEACTLRNEIAVLKSTNTTLEQEKDKIMVDLDVKTEKLYRAENELKLLKRKNDELELIVSDLQVKLDKVISQRKQRENELDENSTQSRTLQQQINTLKEIRDQAVVENSQLSNELAEGKAEICLIKRKLKEAEKEVERLKQQLQQYVQKVQKADDLLMQKECEREEMLEHYRTLSHDAILLEGNNQSLEMEAAEHKRQLLDAEEEISTLKQELRTKECTIEKLEKQVSVLSSQICCLEKDLDQAYDDQKLLKADLDAMKELCEKLDLQSDKQNAELQERGEIISKLEKEISEMRKHLNSSSTSDKAATDILQDLLAKSRQELESERKTICKLAQEKLDLRKKIEEMQKKLEEEREKASQKEALAKEYSIQIKEMQHNITDDRFKRARSREESPRLPKTQISSGYDCPSTRSDNDLLGCGCGLYTNRTYCADQFLANVNQNISQNACSNKISSRICQKQCTIDTRTKDKNRKQNLICSSEKPSFKSNPNSSKGSSLKCMKSILKSIPPCKRSDMLQDVNNFLRGTDGFTSYDETISVDEDSDDIIVRRTRNLITGKIETSKPLNGETWNTIFSSTSKSSRSPKRGEEKSKSRLSSVCGSILKEKKSSLPVCSSTTEAKTKKKERSKSIYIPVVPIKTIKHKKPTLSKQLTPERKKQCRENSPSSRSLKGFNLEESCNNIRSESAKDVGIKSPVKKDSRKQSSKIGNNDFHRSSSMEKTPKEIQIKSPVKKESAKEYLEKNKTNSKNSATLKQLPIHGKIKLPDKTDFNKDLKKSSIGKKESQCPRETNTKTEKPTETNIKEIMDTKETKLKMGINGNKEQSKTSHSAQKSRAKEEKEGETRTEIRPQAKMKKVPVPVQIKKEEKKTQKDEELKPSLKDESGIKEGAYFDVYRLTPQPRGYDDCDWEGYEPSGVKDMSAQTEPDVIEISDEELSDRKTKKTEEGIKSATVKKEYPEVKSSVKVKKDYVDAKRGVQMKNDNHNVKSHYKTREEPVKIKPSVKVKQEFPEVKASVKTKERPISVQIKKERPQTSVVKLKVKPEGKIEPPEVKTEVPAAEEKKPQETKLSKEVEVTKDPANSREPQKSSLADIREYEEFSLEATSSFEEKKIENMPPGSTDTPKTSLADTRECEEEKRFENVPQASSEVPTLLISSAKKRLSLPGPFKGCDCMKGRYQKIRTLLTGDSSMSIRDDKVGYYRRSIIRKRSNNRIEQTYLLEREASRIPPTPHFDTSCLPPPPEYDRCKKDK